MCKRKSKFQLGNLKLLVPPVRACVCGGPSRACRGAPQASQRTHWKRGARMSQGDMCAVHERLGPWRAPANESADGPTAGTTDDPPKHQRVRTRATEADDHWARTFHQARHRTRWSGSLSKANQNKLKKSYAAIKDDIFDFDRPGHP